MKFSQTKLAQRALSVLLSLALACCMLPAAAFTAVADEAEAEAALNFDEGTLTALIDNLTERFTTGTDAAIDNNSLYAALAVAELDEGESLDAASILANLNAASYLSAGTLAKYILALDAAGADVEAIADNGSTRNLVSEMEAMIEASGMPDAWSLVFVVPVYSIATTGSAEVAAAAQAALLASKNDAGLFGASYEYYGYTYYSYDVQTTAQALLALADEYGEDATVTASVDATVEYVLSIQNTDGGFYYMADYGYTDSDADTTGNMLAALVALQEAGANVPTSAVEAAAQWLIQAADSTLDGYTAASSYNEVMTCATAFYGLAMVYTHYVVVDDDEDADEDEPEAQTIKVAKAAKILKVKKVKKAAKTVKFTVKGAQTKLIAKAANAKAKKALKVSVKGKKVSVKVKKGTKKGTYKVKVYAKATDDYEQSNTVTLKIKVK